MALIEPLPHDYAGDLCEPEAVDIQDALNATAIAINRSTVRIGKAEETMRRCHTALLIHRQTVERTRQLLARTARLEPNFAPDGNSSTARRTVSSGG